MKGLLLFLLSFLFSIYVSKAQEDFRTIFGKDYTRAVTFLDQLAAMDSLIESYGLAPKEVKAIVFPELIRYNSIRDKIETFALETLYVQYGKAYANFSIGPFQIKPDFAEKVEHDLVTNNLHRPFGFHPEDTIQSEENRLHRVQRLKEEGARLRYVCAFMQLMNLKYAPREKAEERIRFYATAYNCGYQKSKAEIERYLHKKFFQTGIGTGHTYNYADISWFYYSQSSGVR